MVVNDSQEMRQEIKIIGVIANNTHLGHTSGTGQTEVTGVLKRQSNLKRESFMSK